MSSSRDDTLAAWGEYHPAGPDKEEEKGWGEWVWEALQGDFNQERTVGQVSFDMVISLIPVVDTVCDIRDLCANFKEYKKDPDNKLTLFFIALTVIGFIPEIGTVVKGIVKIVFAYLRKYVTKMDDLLVAGRFAKLADKAVDAALPKIYEYLQNSRWVKWATNNRVPDLFRFAAKKLNEFADQLSDSKLRQGFDEGIKTLNSLLDKLKSMVPATIRERIVDFQQTVRTASGKIRSSLGQFVEPIRITLRITAKKLDDHYWVATTQTVNRGWIAPMASSTAAEMINKTKPHYASEIVGTLRYPKINAQKYERELLGKTKQFEQRYPGKRLPAISNEDLENFHQAVHADMLAPGTKLYRLVDPTNAAGGAWWIGEAEFKDLMKMKQGAKDEWRKRFAIPPDWNQDGKYVEYIVPDGGLPVWRGKAASQEVRGTSYQLEGGHEQFYFQPIQDSYTGKPRIDTTTGQPVINPRNGEPDIRIAFTDQKGKQVDKKLPIKVNDPNIRGPFDTGWGYDSINPTMNGKIGLPPPPEQ